MSYPAWAEGLGKYDYDYNQTFTNEFNLRSRYSVNETKPEKRKLKLLTIHQIAGNWYPHVDLLYKHTLEISSLVLDHQIVPNLMIKTVIQFLNVYES